MQRTIRIKPSLTEVGISYLETSECGTAGFFNTFITCPNSSHRVAPGLARNCVSTSRSIGAIQHSCPGAQAISHRLTMLRSTV
jgi:hypothetical protein